MTQSNRNTRKTRRMSRRRKIEKLENRVLLAADIEFRSFDGADNNEDNPAWGAANTQLVRLTDVEYGPGPAAEVVRDADGSITDVVYPALASRLDSSGATINPRTVSNIVFQQGDESILNDRGLTSFTFQWGQFLDHDLDLTEDFAPVGGFAETFDGEDISFEDDVVVPMLRSRFEVDDEGIAQQINQITSYIDASNVYGSDHEKGDGLRAGYGGYLLTSDGLSNLAGESIGGRWFPAIQYAGAGKRIATIHRDRCSDHTGSTVRRGRRPLQRTARPDVTAHTVRAGTQLSGPAYRPKQLGLQDEELVRSRRRRVHLPGRSCDRRCRSAVDHLQRVHSSLVWPRTVGKLPRLPGET